MIYFRRAQGNSKRSSLNSAWLEDPDQSGDSSSWQAAALLVRLRLTHLFVVGRRRRLSVAQFQFNTIIGRLREFEFEFELELKCICHFEAAGFFARYSLHNDNNNNINNSGGGGSSRDSLLSYCHSLGVFVCSVCPRRRISLGRSCWPNLRGNQSGRRRRRRRRANISSSRPLLPSPSHDEQRNKKVVAKSRQSHCYLPIASLLLLLQYPVLFGRSRVDDGNLSPLTEYCSVRDPRATARAVPRLDCNELSADQKLVASLRQTTTTTTTTNGYSVCA